MSNLSENWRKFKQHFNIFMTTLGKSEKSLLKIMCDQDRICHTSGFYCIHENRKKYSDQVDDILRDCVFMGVYDKTHQKEMLKTHKLMLEKVCELANLAEISRHQLNNIHNVPITDSGLSSSVNALAQQKHGQNWK
ncbi:hypothetical protein PR048_013686 [Dryococelus australis]|uniref:Uncharacterized protein n=1 Tax=Dryococelus australis TaxID=614101 RepID=A0ABQ9HT08_9NEOP|nr:hypothetical protein PR048_013686 [Dryococelus australis]